MYRKIVTATSTTRRRAAEVLCQIIDERVALTGKEREKRKREEVWNYLDNRNIYLDMPVIHFDSPSTEENIRYKYIEASTKWKFARNILIRSSIQSKSRQIIDRRTSTPTSLHPYNENLQPKQQCYSDPETTEWSTSAPTTHRHRQKYQLIVNTTIRVTPTCNTLQDQPMPQPCLLGQKTLPTRPSRCLQALCLPSHLQPPPVFMSISTERHQGLIARILQTTTPISQTLQDNGKAVPETHRIQIETSQTTNKCGHGTLVVANPLAVDDPKALDQHVVRLLAAAKSELQPAAASPMQIPTDVYVTVLQEGERGV